MIFVLILFGVGFVVSVIVFIRLLSEFDVVLISMICVFGVIVCVYCMLSEFLSVYSVLGGGGCLLVVVYIFVK